VARRSPSWRNERATVDAGDDCGGGMHGQQPPRVVCTASVIAPVQPL
jgi:hypothetical protein